MWLLAFEPASVFFSSLLHKESIMILAIGMVAFGGAKLWNRGEPRHLAPIIVGCLLAVATRPYAGWFLIAASAAIIFHAGLRVQRRGGIRSLGLVALVVLFAAIAAPIVLEASTDESLRENLQVSQEANATDGSNLKLERVDFSTRVGVVTNLPRRSLDVLLRPYPWQLGNISQGLGALGTAVVYLLLALLVASLFRNRHQLMARAGPLVYLGVALVVAYSLSAGNAGTAFRYRTQIVMLFICLIIVLRESAEQSSSESAPSPRPTPQLEPTHA
jgi:O-antigen ligase